jgi:hypothetical protein
VLKSPFTFHMYSHTQSSGTEIKSRFKKLWKFSYAYDDDVETINLTFIYLVTTDNEEHSEAINHEKNTHSHMKFLKVLDYIFLYEKMRVSFS